MSTVDKMLIKGIRALDPENTHACHHVFQASHVHYRAKWCWQDGYYRVLEPCLHRGATSKFKVGSYFYSRSKVAGETETKGQIKLRFKTAAEKNVVCIRSLQLTQKASMMEYKAIESVIQTLDHNGEKVALSYKCADIDREIPALMGVSKAILENLIFVHQDDENWPKRKFDDIFSAVHPLAYAN